MYDDYIYPAGEYEAVLITIGDGEGANWWCVLFPPLCFLDFSNGSTIAESDDEPIDDEDIVDVDLHEEERNDIVRSEEKDENNDEEETEVKFFLFEWLGLS